MVFGFFLASLASPGDRFVVTVVAVGGPAPRGLGGRGGELIVLLHAVQDAGIVALEGRLDRVGHVEEEAGRDEEPPRAERQKLQSVDGRLDVAVVQELVAFQLGLRLRFHVTVVPAVFLVFDVLGFEPLSDVPPTAVDPNQEGYLETDGSDIGGRDFLQQVPILRVSGTGNRKRTADGSNS